MKKKVVLVTGVKSDLGCYISNLYARKRTYDVIALDTEKHKDLTDSSFLTCNLTNENDIIKTFKKIPKIDLAINCVSTEKSRQALLEYTMLDIQNIFNRHFSPLLNAVKSQLRIMRHQTGGSIINVSEINNQDLTDIINGSLISLTQIAAQEHHHIRCNAIVSLLPASYDDVYVTIKMLEKNLRLNGKNITV